MPSKGIQGIEEPGKRRKLNVSAKLEILKRVDERPNTTKKALAKDLGLPVTTLQQIIKDRVKIENAATLGNLEQHRMKAPKYPELEKALVQFITQARSMPVKIPVNTRLLKTQAKTIALRLGITDFTERSGGWLSRFKRRNRILFRKVSGESADVFDDTVDAWRRRVLPSLLKGYELKDIYNADEFGLFLNLLPDRTMCFSTEESSGNKQSRARLTILLGCNADGTDKLRPLVIGKAKNPRCFAKIRSLPCDYSDQVNAWMTTDECTRWLEKLNNKMRIQKRKIVLLFDNCPSHPQQIQLSNVKMVYLPKNTTSKLQPCDKGIIKNVKHYYRTRLVQRLCNLIGKPNVERKDCLVNVYQALHFLQWAWNQVKAETIANCFKKAGVREFTEADYAVDDAESAEGSLNSFLTRFDRERHPNGRSQI
ncbi:tigger transposable element-derived protein 6-like [Thrips palmi]|uniref:Tigger transposable element-derived protein 6-like n=1 Tax=Thrips palmi TaxID=161013 RepID=A0A6P8ZYI4_THRPL|nr:tigger transposable element-derived protein 6-like [Thrips palmi]